MSDYVIDKPTRDGEALIKRWQEAEKQLQRANETQSRADCEFQNAKIELGRWLTPKDGKVGEKFSIWYGAMLIEVEVIDLNGNGTYHIFKRHRN